MSTFTRDRYYGADQGYYEGQDEIPEEELPPQVRRQAERIVHRCRMSTFRQWWIGFVGGTSALTAIIGMVLASIGNFILAAFVLTSIAALGCLYLTSISLRGH